MTLPQPGSALIIHISCYHRRLSRCPGAGLPPGDMLALKCHSDTGAMPIYVTYDANRALMTSRPGLLLETMSGAMAFCSLGLCWCWWCLLPPKDTQIARIWAATCDKVGVWELCHCWGHTDLNDMHSQPGPWHHGTSGCWGHAWVPSPAAAKVCVDVRGSCCHRRPFTCLGSGVTPKVMLVFEDLSATGSMLTWVTCTASWGYGDI